MKNNKFKEVLKKPTILFFTPLCLIAANTFGQTGVIKGTVTEKSTNEGAFVEITLNGQQTLNAFSEADGTFLFEKLIPGIYSLILTGDGLNDTTLHNIIVKENDTISFPISMTSKAEKLEEITISTAKSTNTNNAIINETRLAGQVISGVSQEQIKMSQDKTAAQVMSRIPGITVVDGRFVMVRGIPERYNQVLLNNAIAPSTEVDRRTFSFDLIPSNVLDRMLIYKSGAPENTGDFAGGLIKVYTANNDDNFTNISLGAGYRIGTTGDAFLQSKGSGTDILGFDNGYRQLPGTFPDQNLRALGNKDPKRVTAAHQLDNNFAPIATTAIPDINAGFSLGRKIFLNKEGSKILSTITALSYGQSYATYQKDFFRYLEWDKVDGNRAEKRFSYVDANYEKENKIGLISNWKLKLNENNSIAFKNLLNQIGENTTVIRTGEDYIQQTGLQRQNYLFQYRSRSVYSGQLEGNHKHKVGKKEAMLNWVLGLNYLYEDQPDLRRFRTIETAPNSDKYRMILPPSSNLYDAGRLYSKLNETGFNHGLNYTFNLKEQENGPVQLKAGYMLDYRMRTFDVRYFSYFYPGNSSLEEQQRITHLPIDQIFAHDNIKINNGLLLEEGTRSSDSYTASNFLSAGYAGLVYPLGNLTLSGGFRAEYNVLQLHTTNDANQAIEVNSPILSPLVFFNTDYNVTEKSKARFAYYRSVNRPEFRELAPFLFYDYQFDAEKYGNTKLTTANIDNIDLRYEIYPRAGESISLGAFYKHFTNPIETQILIRSESPAFSYQNAKSAYSAGLELEVRKSLKGIFNNQFLDKISLNLNAAIIQSQVNYGDTAMLSQDSKRALQGQSPYIINAIVNYNHPGIGLQVNASYNIFGRRIYAVGSALFPTIYEMPRNVFDLTVSKTITQKWSVKVGIADILNAPYRFYQDTDRNTKINMSGIDDSIFNYTRGTNINLSIHYKF